MSIPVELAPSGFKISNKLAALFSNEDRVVFLGQRQSNLSVLFFYRKDALPWFKQHELCFCVKVLTEMKKCFGIVQTYCSDEHMMDLLTGTQSKCRRLRRVALCRVTSFLGPVLPTGCATRCKQAG